MSKPLRDTYGRQRGIALIAVLWGLVLLAIIAASVTATSRTETRLARNLVENAKAQALADAGIHRAILGLLERDAAKRLRADGSSCRFAFAEGEATITLP